MGKKLCAVTLTVILLGVIAFGEVGATGLGATVTENMYGSFDKPLIGTSVMDTMYGFQNALLYDTSSTSTTDDAPDEEQEIELNEKVEGDWLISDTKEITTPQLDDNKATLGTKDYADFELTASVKVFRNDAKSDAGLFFRATNLTTGQNAFTGYYVGLDAYRDKIVFGRVNNDWSNLATVSMTISANTYYKLSVRAVGNNLKIYVNGALKANVTDSSPILTAGKVGLRASQTGANYKNISCRTIYPLSVTSGSWTTSYSPVAYTVAQGADDKVSFTGHSYADLDFTSYVKLGREDASSDAGVFFRASNIGTGTNAFTGYYVGLNANQDWLLLGRVNNGWTGLRTVDLEVNANRYYKLQVKALGNRIQVYVDDALLIDMVDMNDPILTEGAVGLRANQTSAIYQLVEVNENPFMVTETFPDYTLSTTSGTWSDDNAEIPTYSVTQGADDKASLSGVSLADIKFSAYMKIGRDDATSDAGIFFRATNIGTGTNGLTGYYVGLDASQNKLRLGRLNNNWTGLQTISMTVNKDDYYKVTVVALGSNIKIYVNDALKINVTDSSPILTAGAIGFRANQTATWYTRVEIEDIAPSSDATLSSLILNQGKGTISPAFSPDITEYSARISAESNARLDLTTTDEKAAVYYDGKLKIPRSDGTIAFMPTLEYGQNTVIIRVIAEDGTEQKYKIKIKKGYKANLYNYYDSGFKRRMGIFEDHEVKLKLNDYVYIATQEFQNTFGLYITSTICPIITRIDQKHPSIDLDIGKCTAEVPSCTDRDTILQDLAGNLSQNQLVTNALWSGYSIYSIDELGKEEKHRSCSWMRNILMLEQNYDINADTNIANTLIHEMAHQYGAKDHYHIGEVETEPCKNYPICSTCGSNEEKRDSYCIMNQSRVANIQYAQDETLTSYFCSDCKNEIAAYLEAYDY